MGVIDLESLERALVREVATSRQRVEDSKRFKDDNVEFYQGRETGLEIAIALLKQLKIAGKVE